ncbi:MAG: right-handed parallel beta-helix repeat-containing protein [Nitrospira sp.]|nr:right-handed parallel beta-helix repeat-containing protein [Nitrospira sp.]
MIIRGIPLLTILLTGCLHVPPALSTTYYISPTGSNANPGTLAKPWLTWAYAFAKSSCGDTLIVMDGTYTTTTHGAPIVTNVCTATTIYTIRAQNERQAHLSSDGSNFGIRTLKAAYIAFEGLHVSMVDRSGYGFSTVQFRSSNHITFKRNLVQFNNRYGNTHMVELYGASDCLIEENEVYDFHRHGIIVEGGSRNIIRRNYVNARSRNAIPGGYNGTSGDNGSGDDAFILYPGDNSIIENNIADGQFSKAFAVEAVGAATNNKWLGNINNGGDKGLEFDARGSSTGQMPNNNYAENFVSINPATGLWGPGSGREGFYARAARGITCKNCTIMGAPSYGFLAADNNGSQVGDGTYGLTLINTLAMNATSGGYSIPGTIDSWSGTNVNAYNNSSSYNPSSIGNWVSKFTTDPQMGTCKVYRPDGSNAKTNNWGAEILYRYENGVLTKVPLWDPATGEFPHGVLVPGVNDVVGQSLFDVHKRLNVNSNGCPFPAHFRKSGSDETAPAAPMDLQAS